MAFRCGVAALRWIYRESPASDASLAGMTDASKRIAKENVMPNALEHFVAKSMGKAKAIGARLEGLTGVFSRLAEQHGEVSVLLMRAKSSQEPEKREDLWNEIRIALLSHEHAELQSVYPILRQHPETRRIAEAHEQEAGELEAAIDELENIDFTSDEWDEKIAALIVLVKHHVDEEESDYFPKAQKAIGKEAAQRLEANFLEAQRAVLSELE